MNTHFQPAEMLSAIVVEGADFLHKRLKGENAGVLSFVPTTLHLNCSPEVMVRAIDAVR
jgi:hypothetical protein